MTRYEFTDRIAAGGMGEVWRGRDTVLGRDVAIKVLKSELAHDPRFRERFAAEARNAASLQHPHIASVYDFGETADADGPRPYLVMELVDGKPLNELLQAGRAMPADRARLVVRQAAEALAAAHAAGIVHRDVKPGNLLIKPDGTVKVTDFGIARAADSAALTSTGEVLGTPHYLSPEQAEGRSATAASDVYSLGVVLYECLTGQRPFSADTPMGVALAHLRQPPPALPADVPTDLRRVVERSMDKDPAQRFASAAEMAVALGAQSGALHEQAAAAAAAAGAATQAVAPAAAPSPPTMGDAEPATAYLPPTQAVSSPTRSTPAQDWGAEPTSTSRRHEEDDDRPSGSKAWYAVAAVLAVAVVVGAIYLFTQRDSGEPPADATTVEIVAEDYIGLSEQDARAQLTAAGFDDIRAVDRANPGEEEEGNVAGISPRGQVSTDSQITLTLWAEKPEATPTEEDTPTEEPSETQEPTPSESPSEEPSESPSASPSGS